MLIRPHMYDSMPTAMNYKSLVLSYSLATKEPSLFWVHGVQSIHQSAHLQVGDPITLHDDPKANYNDSGTNHTLRGGRTHRKKQRRTTVLPYLLPVSLTVTKITFLCRRKRMADILLQVSRVVRLGGARQTRLTAATSSPPSRKYRRAMSRCTVG